MTDNLATPAVEANITTPAAPSVAQEGSISAPEPSPVPEIQVPQADVVVPDVNGFFQTLTPELQQFQGLKNFKDVNDLAKSYLNAQSLIGKRIQDMTQEDLKHINGLKGMPTSPDKYKLPEDLQGEKLEFYQKTAHEAGLTQEQAKKVVDKYIEMERSMQSKAEEAAALQAKNYVNELKQEFGDAFDNRVQVAKRAVDAFGGQELKDLLNETGLGNNPKIVKMFAKIGQNLLEDQVIEGDYEKVFGVSPQEAKETISRKLLEPEFRGALYSATHPAHNQAVEEYNKLLSAMGANSKG